jgi:hypothetical protein
MTEYNRISGRVGSVIRLDTTFYHNGVPENPAAIHRVDIYQTAVKEENLVAQVVFPDPGNPLYPLPAVQDDSGSEGGVGHYYIPWPVPADMQTPDIYFDVWRFTGTSQGTDFFDDEEYWTSQCNRFWLYSDNWFADDGLTTIRLGFEAMDKHFKKPEMRNLEVGIMPLPLYDFDYNKIIPLIPQMQAFITIETDNCEVLVDSAPAKIGLRQGSYRTNPFVVQYKIDTSAFLSGSYKYRVILALPDGDVRASDYFRLTIS